MRACPTMASMAPLRVRSGADINLADAFGLPGCPLCRERRRTEAAYLESILSESVNDIPFRQAFDEARGFCARHARAVLDADRARAGSLGASILLRATLVARLRGGGFDLGLRARERCRAEHGPQHPVLDPRTHAFSSSRSPAPLTATQEYQVAATERRAQSVRRLDRVR